MHSRSHRTLGIDASNIRAGGGLTHLAQLLHEADPTSYGFDRVILWAGRDALDRIDDRPWLTKVQPPLLNAGLVARIFWQVFRLSSLAQEHDCDVLFVPGGSYSGRFRPVVAFSQNLLPFEWRELLRFGWSLATVKFMVLRYTQARTFRRAEGVIFLTSHARQVVLGVLGGMKGLTAVISHGVDTKFTRSPREQLRIEEYCAERPFRILYVSQINFYKHQWNVVEAVAILRDRGFPVVLDLIGPAYEPALRRLRSAMKRWDPRGEFVRYLGPLPYSELHEHYFAAHMFVFASSCETFGQILTEAMLAGLPIACSGQPALRELLGNAGIYFNPESPSDVARALQELIESQGARAHAAAESFERAKAYSWKRCAMETFEFVAKAGNENEPSRRLEIGNGSCGY